MSTPDEPTFTAGDRVELDGEDTGLTLGDLLTGPGVFTLTADEDETYTFFHDLITEVEAATGQDLSAARPVPPATAPEA